MKEKFERIWNLALPYLKKGKVKDFVTHTEGVVRAMKLLLEKENGDGDILIPAAILHDVGWSKVPEKLQKSGDKSDKKQALKLHIKYASSITQNILENVGYSEEKTEKIIDIISAHKFQDPGELDKQLLIDADALSDVFKKQFYSDVKSYGTSPRENYRFRKKNTFYTETARNIFSKELEKRKKEV